MLSLPLVVDACRAETGPETRSRGGSHPDRGGVDACTELETRVRTAPYTAANCAMAERVMLPQREYRKRAELASHYAATAFDWFGHDPVTDGIGYRFRRTSAASRDEVGRTCVLCPLHSPRRFSTCDSRPVSTRSGRVPRVCTRRNEPVHTILEKRRPRAGVEDPSSRTVCQSGRAEIGAVGKRRRTDVSTGEGWRCLGVEVGLRPNLPRRGCIAVPRE